MNNRTAIFLLAWIGVGLWAASPAWSTPDTVYISDMLRVGVRPEPDSRSTPVGVVVTGMKLEVLGSSNGYLQIRTEKGLTGWIKDIYATEKPPAIIRLENIEEQHGGTVTELEELRETVGALEEANSNLNNQLDQIRADRSRLQLRLAQSASAQQSDSSGWVFWLLALILCASAAFAGGVFWQRRQTTRRLGGLRL